MGFHTLHCNRLEQRVRTQLFSVASTDPLPVEVPKSCSMLLRECLISVTYGEGVIRARNVVDAQLY